MTAPHAMTGWSVVRVARSAAFCALGALLWSLPVLLRLRRVPEGRWIARDDGVITLSHARNFADHGTIGVSPGGDRVEGFSSPLHFSVASVIERFGDPSARTLTLVILAIGLVVSGVAMTWATLRRWERVGVSRPWAHAVGSVIVLGALTAVPWTTTGWLGSGMENPLILASMCLVVAGTIAGLDRASSRGVAVVGAFLLMIARVEFAALAGPVLIALLASDSGWRGWPRPRAAVKFVVAPLGAAALVHLLRRWYFGEWLPNTAIVQDRDAGTEQLAVILLVALGFAALLARWRSGTIGGSTPRAVGVLAAATALACGVGVLWFEATGRTVQPVSSLLVVPGIVEFGVLVAAGLAVRNWFAEKPATIDHWVLAGLVLLPLVQYVVTGPARLDDNRIVGLAVPVLIWWSVLVWAQAVRAAVGSASETAARFRWRVGGSLAALLLVVGAGATARADGVRTLSFEIGWADSLVVDAVELSDEHFAGDGLVITATPDLGKVSFAKRSHMVDLGWLGDPLFASLRATRPDLMDSYLLRVAVPDLVATHGGWSCAYRGWLEHPDFVAEYALIGDPDADWRRGEDTCPADGTLARWERVDDRGEFELTRRILTAEDPAAVVGEAVAACADLPGDSLRCQPVRRAVQRSAPLLHDAGTFDAVVRAFDVSPSAEFDRLMLERGPAWWVGGTDAVIELLDGFVT